MPVNPHRIAHWLWAHGVPLIPHLIKSFNRIVFAVVLPPSARLGKGVLLSCHGLGTVIHRNARIGDRVSIGAGVTIGGRSGHSQVPVIDDDAMIGAGAKILGPVRIGRGASIGANAVVLNDVQDYAVAVGVPARVIKVLKPEDMPDYFAYRKRTD